MKTKKLLTIALTGVVAVGLVGCGASGDKTSNGKKVVTNCYFSRLSTI